MRVLTFSGKSSIAFITKKVPSCRHGSVVLISILTFLLVHFSVTHESPPICSLANTREKGHHKVDKTFFHLLT